jgi:hypothetical protein
MTTPNIQRQEEAQRRAEALSDHTLSIREDSVTLNRISNILAVSGIPTVGASEWGPAQVLEVIENLETAFGLIGPACDPLTALVVPKHDSPATTGDVLEVMPVCSVPLD